MLSRLMTNVVVVVETAANVIELFATCAMASS